MEVSPSKSTFLFVYGTLMRGFENPHKDALSREAVFVCNGSFQGRLYRITWYPAAVDSEDAEDEVSGEVYHVLRPDRLMPLLDSYEGYSPMSSDTSEYVRGCRPIVCEDGVLRVCEIYLYNRDLFHAKPIPSGMFRRPPC